MASSVYIYYRIVPERAAQARPSLERLVVDVSAQIGVTGRLLHRRDDPTTWMEVYESVPDIQRFKNVLADAITRCDATSFLELGTTRVVEEFVSFA